MAPKMKRNEISRREMLRTAGSALTALALGQSLYAASNASRGKRMGVVIFSYHLRNSSKNDSQRYPRFKDAIELLEHCHAYGAGGVQVGVNDWERVFARKVRDRREQLDMFLEGQIRLPKNESDLALFESKLKAAKEAGASVLRVALGGRRYEQFDQIDGWKAMKAQAWESFRLAEPVAAKHRVKIGIENHKDWRIPDMLEFMEGLSSEWMGVCIDTGNSIALLEHPMETVEAFAKYAVTTHIKDMGVKEYADGFLLSEVPIGHGFLDMKRVFEVCEKANPQIQFCLEMATRDPLKVPCLTDQYWATFENVEPLQLARAIAMVRKNESPRELPRITGRPQDERLRLEEKNIRQCVQYAEKHLGLRG